MNKPKVLLLENIHELATNAFAEVSFQTQTKDQALEQDQLSKAITNINLLGIRSRTQITQATVDAATQLSAIGAFCIGTNQIDLEACTNAGIPVFNAPYSNTRSVTELVIGHIITLMRKTFDKSKLLHQGDWQKSASGCYEVRRKNLGIVGYGNIGTQLSVLAESLGMNVYYYDVADKLSHGNAIRCRTLQELLKVSDVLTVHVDGRGGNKNLIGKKELQLMKPGSYLINFSRGSNVDLKALAQSIKSGHTAGASIDVFPQEPKKNGGGFKSELQNLPNVILTPHIGAATEEAQESIGEYVSRKLINYQLTGDTTLSVNFPGLELPPVSGVYRCAHIHHNQPGILAAINDIFAEHKINIEGQYLKTNESIGYVITDVNKPISKNVAGALQSIKSTIKFRQIN